MTGESPATEAAVGPQCYGDVCVTCSDTAVEVVVVRLLGGGLAEVDTGSSVEEVSVALVEADVGDSILVHAKEAIAVLAAGHPAAEPRANTRAQTLD